MATYTLSPGQNIQTQISACNLAGGDIINLESGEYSVENGSIPSTGLLIDRYIKLNGAGKSDTVLNGTGLALTANTIKISANGINNTNGRLEITNMTVTGKRNASIFSEIPNENVQYLLFKNLLINCGGFSGLEFSTSGATPTIHKYTTLENVEVSGENSWMSPVTIVSIVDAGDGKIAVNTNGVINLRMRTGATVRLEGTTGYDGDYQITDIVTNNQFKVVAAFTGESTGGTWTTPGSEYGIRFRWLSQFIKMTDVNIHDIQMDRNNVGIGITIAPSNGGFPEKTMIWDVRNLTISNCGYKALYVENMEQAYFKDITISNCGNHPGATGHAAGIDFNFKFDEFKNILMENLNITNSGNTDHNSAGLMLKVRDHMTNPFGGYGVKPASLNSFVIMGGKISGSQKGIRLGEENNGVPECNMGPVGIDIRNFQIENCTLDTIHDVRINRNGFIYNNRYFVS